jgi:TetR/AcrR family transcriptional regulator, transcriptional repressor for nem operon
MAKKDAENSREKVVQAGIELIRRNGYVATTVDEICAEAGVTKGAFFHHFASKEALAEACLGAWTESFAAMIDAAPFQSIGDPVEKLVGCMDFFIGMFGNPQVVKSCLAGTVVQEVSESHPVLRARAQACFAAGEQRFRELLDAVCGARDLNLDTASIAKLWVATIQGSFLLAKASRDDAVVATSLGHVKRYIQALVSGLVAVGV